MNSIAYRKKCLIPLLLILLLFTCNYFFDSINQPEIVDPNSDFDVEIIVRLETEDRGGVPYFGIRLPVGWNVSDSIHYDGVLSGTLVYSEMLSDSMERIEEAPHGYYWWVSVGDTVDSLLDGTVSIKPTIQTDDQTGLFFIDYMLGDSGNGLNFRRNDHHPVSIGLSSSVIVKSTDDSGKGSLRQALAEVAVGGKVLFDLTYPATILLDSQLVIDRNITIMGPEDGVLRISGNKKDRVIYIDENLEVNISNLTLSDGYIEGEKFGGGIFCIGSTLNLSNMTITKSAAHSGGAIYSRHSDLKLSNLIITQNSALLDDGGGISCVDCNLICTNTLIVDNMAADEGGGIECRGSSLNLTNMTIANNTAPIGAGMYLGDSKASVTSSILWHNSTQSILLNSSAIKMAYSDIDGGFIGDGNIEQNPLFADTVNYYLDNNSPCIDTGDPDSLFNDPEDTNNPGFALWPALGKLRNDMGAYGGHGKFKITVWDVISGEEIETIDFINKNTGWLVGSEKIIKTENGGESWEVVLTKWQFHRIDFINESVGWAIGNTSNVFKTVDGGQSWQNLKQFRHDYNFTALSAVDNNVMYMVAIVTGTPYPAGAIIKTVDGGKNWMEITPDYDRWDLESVWAIDKNICIASGRSSSWGGGILRTLDGGITWHESKVPEFGGIYKLQFTNDSLGYFLADKEILYQTQDTCKSWNKQKEGINAYSAPGGNSVFAIIGDKFMKSFNAGETWVGRNLDHDDYRLVDFVDDSTGWIVGRDGVILKTNDGGNSWIDQRHAVITEIQDQEYQYDQIPEQFIISQNYPNPFNPSTMINYQLPMNRFVDLSIYNILGQKVKTLVSQNQQAGTYQVEWDATGFASGIYYYKLVAGDYMKVKKMILLR